MRTPEGDFYVCTMHPSKRFYKFLGLSYPALKHAEFGRRSGMISEGEFLMIKKALEEGQPPPWNTRLGGAVGIHGRTAAPGDGIQKEEAQLGRPKRPNRSVQRIDITVEALYELVRNRRRFDRHRQSPRPLRVSSLAPRPRRART